MVNALFTAFALIATGQVRLPPVPTDLAPPPPIRRPDDRRLPRGGSLVHHQGPAFERRLQPLGAGGSVEPAQRDRRRLRAAAGRAGRRQAVLHQQPAQRAQGDPVDPLGRCRERGGLEESVHGDRVFDRCLHALTASLPTAAVNISTSRGKQIALCYRPPLMSSIFVVMPRESKQHLEP